jgi:hypothetical protein
VIPLDAEDLAGLATTALAAVRREYPHRLDQELHADADLLPPRRLSPAFYGSYDWHSAVHNHWLLVRALDRGLPAPLAEAVTAVLDEHLTDERLAAEAAFFAGPGGATAERPYGWAWLIMLHAECQAADDGRQRRWALALTPLARLLSHRLNAYFGGQLRFPIRSGTHRNTAFSLRLAIDAARRRGDEECAAELARTARRMFGRPKAGQWDRDPSGDDFLTPELTEAALMADILPGPEPFSGWLERVLPDASPVAWEPPDFRPDATDPATIHLEGLLVSRAWCLYAMAKALPDGHPVSGTARSAADLHLAKAARIRPDDGFGRSHWLPTFLLYLDEQVRAD